MIRARSLALLGLLLAALTPAWAQESQSALAKFQLYLDRKPYHESVFEQLVGAAVAGGTLPELEGVYAQRLERDPQDTAARIVLARLLAGRREPQQALDLLAQFDTAEVQLIYLRGRLRIAKGDLAAGAAALDRAAGMTKDIRLATDILTLAGRTWMRLDQSTAAQTSFLALAQLQPGSFSQSILVAELMANSGLDDAAREQLAAALELARGDAEREVRAHIAIGRVHERAGRSVAAQLAYTAAAALMGPDHWQHRELFERRLAIHFARGTLDELIESCRAEMQVFPASADHRRLLALALRTDRRMTEALDVLQTATRAFPESLRVGKEYARFLTEEGRLTDAIAEYQRIANRHQRELGLHREAGLLLASMGDRDSALIQWRLELSRLPQSIELHLDLARVQSQLGMHVEAERLLLSATTVAPHDLRPVRELGRIWRLRGRASRLGPLLEQAQRRAISAGDANLLEELGEEWLNRDDERRAILAMEEALKAGGRRDGILPALSYLLESHGTFKRTSEVLFELMSMAQEPLQRFELGGRIAALYEDHRRGPVLVREQRRLLERDPAALATRLVLVRALGDAGKDKEVNELLSVLEESPEYTEDLLWHRIWQCGTSNDIPGLRIAWLRELAEAAPRHARRALQKIISIHRSAKEHEKADAVEEELLSMGAASRTTLLDLAQRQLRRKKPMVALDYLTRSLALYPRDDETRLQKAKLLLDMGQKDAANVEIERVLSSTTAAHRTRARLLCRNANTKPYLIELIDLGAQMQAEQKRWSLGIIRASYALEIFDYQSAQRIVDDLLLRFPTQISILELNEELRGLTPASLSRRMPLESAVFEPRTAELQLAELFLTQNDSVAARRALAALDSPVLAANLCSVHGKFDEARRLLEAACRDDDADPHLWMRLAIVSRLAKHGMGAARALDKAVALGRSSWELLLAQGAEYLRRGHRLGARKVGEQLFGRLSQTRSLASKYERAAMLHERRVEELVNYHMDNGLQREFLRAGISALKGPTVTDLPLLKAVLERMDKTQGYAARALLAKAGAYEFPASGWEILDWKRLLMEQGERFERKARSVPNGDGR